MITHPEIDLDQALEELRHGALGLVAPGLMVLGFMWALVSMMLSGIATSRDVPALTLVAAMALILVVRRRYPNLACWLLLPATVVTQGLIVRYHPSAAMIYLGTVSVVLLSAVLGLWQAILGAALVWAAGALMARETALRPEVLNALWFYALTASAVWLAGRSLRVAISWALTGWQRAREALDEARERRGELHRSLRALEEATYRIERMNNELILARGEAEAARADKAHFVATVSHEIRGPLNLILGFSRLMALSPERYKNALPTDYRADVATIYRNSRHLASLVDDILDMSQIEAARLPLIKEWVDLETEVIGEALQIARPLADRKKLRLTLDLHGALPPLLIDPVRIRQILLNLLINAARFTETGSITLRTRIEEMRVVVSVTDTGAGISQENLSQLFGAFQQFSPGDRAADRGSGLGLSISKQLVELHGGEIWAESHVGAGTTVSFGLPLPGVIGSTISRPTRDPGSRAAPGQDHVLVIHQDPEFIKILSRYLEGYQIIGLPTETELAPVIEELHPRAVIAASRLAPRVKRELSMLSYDVPLIVCAMPQLRSDAATEGVLSYLIKPVSREMLLAAMGQIHEHSESTVLIVDDDPDSARLIEKMLLAIPQRYRILKAFDGAQALQVMEADVPDVALVDLMMPGMDGEELIARMRRDPRFASVPVIIVSARDRSEAPVSIGLPLSVSRRGPLGMSDAAECLLSMLKMVPPRYLPGVELALPGPEPALGSRSAPPR